MTISTSVIVNQQVDFNTDYFEAQESDANGEVVLSLTQTPTGATKVWATCTKDDRVCVVTGLSGTDLTVTTYKTTYKKLTAITGALTNLPASVTEASTIQSPGSSTVNGGVANSSTSNVTTTTHSHSTSISHIYRHDHPFTLSDSALELATSENDLSFVVQYQV